MNPKTMIAVEVPQAGGPEVLRLGERPVPQCRPGEVLIRVAAAGVNRADVMQRNGIYPPPPGVSDLLGLEVSGTIAAAAPDVTEWSVGDAVCALLAGGGYAQYCTVPAALCLPVPNNMEIVTAASLPETFFTVWTNVFMRGRLTRGERFLVHGGASGIGTTAIALAHALGAKVATTAGSDAKCDRCRQLGAVLAVNYRSGDYVEQVLKWTQGQGVDLILDIIGGPYFSGNLRCLADEGRMVIIATQGGLKTEFNILPIMQKRLTITGSTLRPRTTAQKSAIARELRAQAWPLLDDQTIAPVIDSVFPIERVREAHERLDCGDHIGKIILTMNEPHDRAAA